MSSRSANARQTRLPARIRQLSGELEWQSITDRCAPIENAPKSPRRASRRETCSPKATVMNWASTLRVELSQRARDFAATQGVTCDEVRRPANHLVPGRPQHVSTRQLHRRQLSRRCRESRLGRTVAKGAQSTARAARRPSSERKGTRLLQQLGCAPHELLLLSGCGRTDSSSDCYRRCRQAAVEFGVAGDDPLQDGSVDTTELDMRAGRVIFESKLTEADFTNVSSTLTIALVAPIPTPRILDECQRKEESANGPAK